MAMGIWIDKRQPEEFLKNEFYRYYPGLPDERINQIMKDKDFRRDIFQKISERGMFNKDFMFLYMREINFGKFLAYGHNSYRIISDLNVNEANILYEHLTRLQDNETLSKSNMIKIFLGQWELISCSWVDERIEELDSFGLKKEAIELVSDHRIEGWFLEKYRDFYDVEDIFNILDNWHTGFDTFEFKEGLKDLIIKHIKIFEAEVHED